jgi:hypothetical protein
VKSSPTSIHSEHADPREERRFAAERVQGCDRFAERRLSDLVGDVFVHAHPRERGPVISPIRALRAA